MLKLAIANYDAPAPSLRITPCIWLDLTYFDNAIECEDSFILNTLGIEHFFDAFEQEKCIICDYKTDIPGIHIWDFPDKETLQKWINLNHAWENCCKYEQLTVKTWAEAFLDNYDSTHFDDPDEEQLPPEKILRAIEACKEKDLILHVDKTVAEILEWQFRQGNIFPELEDYNRRALAYLIDWDYFAEGCDGYYGYLLDSLIEHKHDAIEIRGDYDDLYI